jgi:hypothetical protein
MKDKLKILWDIQFNFNQNFYKAKLGKSMEDMSQTEKTFWTKNQLLSIVKEAMEVLDEVPSWKEHRSITENFIPSNLYEEIIDVNKFSMGLAQIWGMTFEQYYEEFLRKSYVVEQRWHQEHDLKLIDKNSKIAGIDIDGILGEYEKCFLNFVSYKTGIEFDSIEAFKKMSGIGVYEETKSQYRQSGAKADMEACKGASEFTYELKNRGYTIIVLTARPYKDYYRIYPDTLEFLKKRNIKFDAIIFDKEKHLKIIREFPNMRFMIDDTYDIAKPIADLSYRVFLKRNKKSVDPHPYIITFDELNDILNYID